MPSFSIIVELVRTGQAEEASALIDDERTGSQSIFDERKKLLSICLVIYEALMYINTHPPRCPSDAKPGGPAWVL